MINIQNSAFICQGCNFTYVINTKNTKRVGIVDVAKNFTKAALKHMASGMSRTPDDIQEKRLAICESCEFYDKSNKHPACTKCGCFLNIKVSWASEGCPVDKWPPVARGRGCGGCGRR